MIAEHLQLEVLASSTRSTLLRAIAEKVSDGDEMFVEHVLGL